MMWMIFYVLVFLDVWPASGAWITWSPGTELQHLAVDPVSGKVINHQPEARPSPELRLKVDQGQIIAFLFTSLILRSQCFIAKL